MPEISVMKKYLILENGAVFEGTAFGSQKETIAEIVFTTGMTGYLETLTDLSYTGQAVVQTFPLIGNYGVIPNDAESCSIGASGYIVREYCETPSNFRSAGRFDDYLKNHDIPGICGVDTRALVRMLREQGTMNGKLSNSPSADIDELRSFHFSKPVDCVSTKSAYRIPLDNAYRVALLDFGVKSNILRSLHQSGCDVFVFPYDATPDELLAVSPDGIFLSNGPGDPAENVEAIENLKKLIPYNIPTMGICLGHQLLALANGFSTEKLRYGHRGANHPVKNTRSGRISITSQNHGYAVSSASISASAAEELFVNLNDKTNEGLIYLNTPAFSVQFHPEACAGPHDTHSLFERFIAMMQTGRESC